MMERLPAAGKSVFSMAAITFSHGWHTGCRRWRTIVAHALPQTRSESVDRLEGAVDREKRNSRGRKRARHAVGHERHSGAAARVFRRPADRASWPQDGAHLSGRKPGGTGE